MRYALSVALLALPTMALAGPVSQPVIGGAAAPAGKWPDAAAVLWSGEQACTGTLIAPTVVITAGHCVEGGAPDAVLVGATAKSRPQEGETINIQRAVAYPDSQSTIDVALLILSTPSTIVPRLIASGWARADIKNGATVDLVGFGTVDRDGNVETDSLMEAASSITDFNCSKSSGCNSGARPDGELGAGGMGIDTCPGDSGGPIYVDTDYGTYLAGVTSRGYDNNQYYCSEGGIYARADKVIDWIETTAGVTLERTPGPTADPIMATRGRGSETAIIANDPKTGAKHTYAIATQPGYGTAAVSASGVVRVCPRKDVVGDDSVVVNVSDAADADRTVALKIPVVIADGSPDDDCDPTDFGGEGGCCDTRRSATGSIPLALFVLVTLRRRRRTR
jgi:secreted trypsin-like serine protease